MGTRWCSEPAEHGSDVDLWAGVRFACEPFVRRWVGWQCVEGVLDALEAIDRIEPDFEPEIPCFVEFFDDSRWWDSIGS